MKKNILSLPMILAVLVTGGLITGGIRTVKGRRIKAESKAFIEKYVSLEEIKKLTSSNGQEEKIESLTIDYSGRQSFGETGYVDPTGLFHLVGYINDDKDLSFEACYVYDQTHPMNLQSQNLGELSGFSASAELSKFLGTYY